MLIKDQKYEILIEFIKNNQQSFYRLALSYVKNPDTALDIVQEAIIKSLNKINTLKDINALKTWFYRILVNESIDFLRANKKQILNDNIENIAFYNIENTIDTADLYFAIDQLEPKLKTIIILRFFEDMKIEDIAKITKSNINTVKTRLYKALKILRNHMDNGGL